MEESVLPPRAKNTLVMIQSSISFHLSLAVDREIAAGMIRNIPFHLLFNTWIGLLHYYLVHAAAFAPGQSVLKRHGRELLEHYLVLISNEQEE
jgi:hypothetical protein